MSAFFNGLSGMYNKNTINTHLLYCYYEKTDAGCRYDADKCKYSHERLPGMKDAEAPTRDAHNHCVAGYNALFVKQKEQLEDGRLAARQKRPEGVDKIEKTAKINGGSWRRRGPVAIMAPTSTAATVVAAAAPAPIGARFSTSSPVSSPMPVLNATASAWMPPRLPAPPARHDTMSPLTLSTIAAGSTPITDTSPLMLASPVMRPAPLVTPPPSSSTSSQEPKGMSRFRPGTARSPRMHGLSSLPAYEPLATPSPKQELEWQSLDSNSLASAGFERIPNTRHESHVYVGDRSTDADPFPPEHNFRYAGNIELELRQQTERDVIDAEIWEAEVQYEATTLKMLEARANWDNARARLQLWEIRQYRGKSQDELDRLCMFGGTPERPSRWASAARTRFSKWNNL